MILKWATSDKIVKIIFDDSTCGLYNFHMRTFTDNHEYQKEYSEIIKLLPDLIIKGNHNFWNIFIQSIYNVKNALVELST